MIFTLKPTNEGQTLNFIERYDPESDNPGRKRLTLKESKTDAKDRAKQVVVGLNRLMPQGTFGCVIEELNLYISPNLEEIKQ
jgi:hypothetical protein